MRLRRGLVTLIDKLLSHEWGNRLIFKTAKNKVISFRQSLIDQINLIEEQNNEILNNSGSGHSSRAGYEKIFLAVYYSQGDNLRGWARVIRQLSIVAASRPVFSSLDEAMAFVNTRPDASREGVLELEIPVSLLLTPVSNGVSASRVVDSRGLDSKYTMLFIHSSGEKYKYVARSGMLEKVDN